ncbi:uncharacterized protein METZ01_LOCUS301196 [marine metagenome]|uniref:Uncharacterized protein n=1 Tax=marine metagenome TaxID=408172 RepID=A0A382MLS2_9ZZZZ
MKHFFELNILILSLALPMFALAMNQELVLA